MWDTTVADLGGADLMMYMAYDSDYYGTVGIAWGKVVCNSAGYNKYKESINEWRKTHAEAGHVRLARLENHYDINQSSHSFRSLLMRLDTTLVWIMTFLMLTKLQVVMVKEL